MLAVVALVCLLCCDLTHKEWLAVGQTLEAFGVSSSNSTAIYAPPVFGGDGGAGNSTDAAGGPAPPAPNSLMWLVVSHQLLHVATLLFEGAAIATVICASFFALCFMWPNVWCVGAPAGARIPLRFARACPPGLFMCVMHELATRGWPHTGKPLTPFFSTYPSPLFQPHGFRSPAAHAHGDRDVVLDGRIRRRLICRLAPFCTVLGARSPSARDRIAQCPVTAAHEGAASRGDLSTLLLSAAISGRQQQRCGPTSAAPCSLNVPRVCHCRRSLGQSCFAAAAAGDAAASRRRSHSRTTCRFLLWLAAGGEDNNSMVAARQRRVE